MRVEDNKIITFEQVITSNNQILGHWLRTIYFKPKCLGHDTYRNMLHLEKNESVTFVDNSLTNTPYNEDLVQKIPKKNIQIESEKLVKGLTLKTELNGAHCQVVIKDISDDYVVVDMNHPWRGKSLLTKITIKNIENPPENFDPTSTSLNTRKFI